MKNVAAGRQRRRRGGERLGDFQRCRIVRTVANAGVYLLELDPRESWQLVSIVKPVQRRGADREGVFRIWPSSGLVSPGKIHKSQIMK